MKYQLDGHTHTLASGHAYNSILEMVKIAEERGLDFLGITDHAPSMPGTCDAIYFNNLGMVETDEFNIEVALGIELNIMDFHGNIDMHEQILKKMDICIASLHGPCIQAGTIEENTSAVIGAIKNPYVNIIGHPDDGYYPLDYEKVVKAAKENHKLLEVNNNSLNPAGFRLNTYENDKAMLEVCKVYNQPIVIGSDAHWISQVGRHDRAKKLIDNIKFPYELVMNYDLEQFRGYINKYRRNF